MSVLKIHAREIFDSRGNPTVEVDLYTKKGNDFNYFVMSQNKGNLITSPCFYFALALEHNPLHLVTSCIRVDLLSILNVPSDRA